MGPASDGQAPSCSWFQGSDKAWPLFGYPEEVGFRVSGFGCWGARVF